MRLMKLHVEIHTSKYNEPDEIRIQEIRLSPAHVVGVELDRCHEGRVLISLSHGGSTDGILETPAEVELEWQNALRGDPTRGYNEGPRYADDEETLEEETVRRGWDR